MVVANVGNDGLWYIYTLHAQIYYSGVLSKSTNALNYFSTVISTLCKEAAM